MCVCVCVCSACRCVCSQPQDTRLGSHTGASVYSQETIVVELVVARQSYQASPTRWEGKENLDSCLFPYLYWHTHRRGRTRSVDNAWCWVRFCFKGNAPRLDGKQCHGVPYFVIFLSLYFRIYLQIISLWFLMSIYHNDDLANSLKSFSIWFTSVYRKRNWPLISNLHLN